MMKNKETMNRKNTILRIIANAVGRELNDPFFWNLYEAERTADPYLMNSLYEDRRYQFA